MDNDCGFIQVDKQLIHHLAYHCDDIYEIRMHLKELMERSSQVSIYTPPYEKKEITTVPYGGKDEDIERRACTIHFNPCLCESKKTYAFQLSIHPVAPDILMLKIARVPIPYVAVWDEPFLPYYTVFNKQIDSYSDYECNRNAICRWFQTPSLKFANKPRSPGLSDISNIFYDAILFGRL